MKVIPAGTSGHHHCFDGICETMDKLGVPRNSKWRALILFMRSIRDYEVYSPKQKRQIQALVVKVLKEGDLTETKFVELSRATEEILTGPWRTKFKIALADMARAVKESRGMILKRKGDIEQLETSTVETIQSGKSLEDALDDIRRGFQDVLQYMEQDAENLAHLCVTDSLTGLNNRRAFDAALAQAVGRAKATGNPLCVIMADIDHFKAFNDQFGHRIGDQALAAVASVIRESQLQAEDDGGTFFAARYGGEEFTIIAQDMASEQAMTLAEHIRHRIETYNFVIRGVDGDILDSGIKLTISLGVACLHEQWKDELEQRLVNAADEALYSAKESGRNRVMPYVQGL